MTEVVYNKKFRMKLKVKDNLSMMKYKIESKKKFCTFDMHTRSRIKNKIQENICRFRFFSYPLCLDSKDM